MCHIPPWPRQKLDPAATQRLSDGLALTRRIGLDWPDSLLTNPSDPVYDVMIMTATSLQTPGEIAKAHKKERAALKKSAQDSIAVYEVLVLAQLPIAV
jgi:hypothetical protein